MGKYRQGGRLGQHKITTGISSGGGRMALIAFVFMLMRVANEVSSNLNIYIQSSVVREFFLPGVESYEQALAKFTVISISVNSVYVFAVFYKSLADRFGRKTLLVMNVFGLALGMLLCFISRGPVMYFCGIAFCTFFIQNDLQMVYILETAPAGRGGRFFGLIKSFGILGLVLIPVLRDFFMGSDTERWRGVFLVPMVLCAAVAVLTLIFIRETKPFLSRRLEPTAEEPKNNAEKPVSSSIGIGAALRHILSHRELRWLIGAYTLYGICSMSCYTYVESIMSTGGMSALSVTRALYIYPFVYAGVSFLSGFAADRFGRKPVVVLTGLAVVFGFALFILGIRAGWSPYVIGLLNGLYLGSFWMCGDYMNVMLLESTPTEIRASVTGGAAILMMGGCAFGIAVQLAVMLVLKDIGVACLLLIVPCMLVSTLMILIKGHETKGTAIETAGRTQNQAEER